MRVISFLMAVNSASRAPRCVLLTVPVAASVARVTARLSNVVTCDMAPSATCSRPTPSVALRADWVRAVTLAARPSAIARPAASSAPELMREPEDSRSKVVFREAPVIDNWFCAARDVMLFRMLSAMRKLLAFRSRPPASRVAFRCTTARWSRWFSNRGGYRQSAGNEQWLPRREGRHGGDCAISLAESPAKRACYLMFAGPAADVVS